MIQAPMKTFLTTVIAVLAVQSADARLGDTRDQAEARYGLPKSERTPKGVAPLLEGAREVTFHHEGFQIRCAFLTATDGQEYVVREEYVRRAGHPAMRDFERNAMLEGEKNGQSWTLKKLDPIGAQDLQKSAASRVEVQYASLSPRSNPTEVLEPERPVVMEKSAAAVAAKPAEPARTPASPFILAGANMTWVRPDGATAAVAHGDYPMRFDLPQAAKYEREMNAAKAKEERAKVPNF
jgi:hypothetical protein